MHLAAVLGKKKGITEEAFKSRGVIHDGTHGEDGVEPIAELAGEAFGDPVGGVPLLPVFGILAIAQCTEGDNAGV